MSHVDTTETITHVSLCAGYGGIDLGLNRAIGNLRTIAFSEIEAFACANLVSKMEAGLLDAAPIWTNLKTFPWGEFRDRVDILSGGYPCQPFSAAGKRLGKEDPRHLWPYIADGIAAMRPSVCFFENVEGHISLGLPDVIEDLAGMGYRTTWGIFSASEVGAPHQRKRVFIMAVSNSLGGAAGLSRSLAWNEGVAGESNHGGGEGCGELADSQHEHDGGLFRKGQLQQQQEGGPCGQRVAATSHQAWPSRPGQPQFSWEPPRVVGNSSDKRKLNKAKQDESEAGSLLDRASEGAGVENAKLVGRRGRDHGDEGGMRGEIQTAGSCSGWSEVREIESKMGRNSHGARSGVGHAELCEPDHAAGGCESESRGGQLDDPGSTEQHGIPSQQWQEDPASWESGYPELYVSCDNRTDELRLLGNGVVPATAALAFRTLWEELTWK